MWLNLAVGSTLYADRRPPFRPRTESYHKDFSRIDHPFVRCERITGNPENDRLLGFWMGHRPSGRQSTKMTWFRERRLTLSTFATAHGLIAIEANGGLHPEKGLAGAAPGLEFLVQLLSRKA